MSNMSKVKVECSFCQSELLRYELNPNTKKPISNFFCDKYCKGEWQRKQKELVGYTKEWLIEEYINKKRSANSIAKEINRDPKRVWEWIKDYGIETRSRGHSTDHLPKDGSSFKGMKHTKETKDKIRRCRLQDGHVPYLKDGIHWLKHEGAVSPKWKGGITPDRQKVYSSEEWSESVKAVWSRDNATCQRCGKNHNITKNRGTFHIHHIVSFMVEELRTDVTNLVLLCSECHIWVHSNKNKTKEFIKEG